MSLFHHLRFLPFLSIVLIPTANALADVTLPSIFSDHMVLTKGAKVPVWGKADPMEEVTVSVAGAKAKARADGAGKWRVDLDLSATAAGPFGMVVEGNNRLEINDVVVGEVWLASGQSNMDFPLRSEMGAAEEIAHSANPLLRYFRVARATSDHPLEDCKGTWEVASPETSARFSAVGYYFGKRLQSELNTPVGIIQTSWGGTPVEAWTSPEAFQNEPALAERTQQVRQWLVKSREQTGQFREQFGQWLQEHDRQDRPVADLKRWTTGSTEEWASVTLPGPQPAPELSLSGAVWLRQEIKVAAGQAGKMLSVYFGDLEGFVSVYWNGKLVHQTRYDKNPGKNELTRVNIPAEKVVEGANQLALRVYAPGAPAHLSSVRIGRDDLLAGWRASMEYSLPEMDAAQKAQLPPQPSKAPNAQQIAGQLFDGMVAPLVPYAIRGVIWYQGETNGPRAFQYRTAFPLMIRDWRNRWQQGDFPFYFCQLANYRPKLEQPAESDWAELREAQTMTLALPKTGQAILVDVGESADIHPRNKKDPGERLARWALAHEYQKKITFSGPTYASHQREGNRMRVRFDHIDEGLTAAELPTTYVVRSLTGESAPLVRNSPGSALEGFAICGEDKKWVWANAEIEGDSVVVWSEAVPQPIAVRYGWADNPTCNLFNGAGLPASPFRTDDFPGKTVNVSY